MSTDLGESANAGDFDLTVDNESEVRMSQGLRLAAKPLRLSLDKLPNTQIVLDRVKIEHAALPNRTWTLLYTAAEICARAR